VNDHGLHQEYEYPILAPMLPAVGPPTIRVPDWRSWKPTTGEIWPTAALEGFDIGAGGVEDFGESLPVVGPEFDDGGAAIVGNLPEIAEDLWLAGGGSVAWFGCEEGALGVLEGAGTNERDDGVDAFEALAGGEAFLGGEEEWEQQEEQERGAWHGAILHRKIGRLWWI
jgi:hypothetical protein